MANFELVILMISGTDRPKEKKNFEVFKLRFIQIESFFAEVLNWVKCGMRWKMDKLDLMDS